MTDVYTLDLGNGVTIQRVRRNGSNFVTDQPIDENLFAGYIPVVEIIGEELEDILYNVELVQNVEQEDGEWWFVLKEKPQIEIDMEIMSANIEYLAMMNDVEL